MSAFATMKTNYARLFQAALQTTEGFTRALGLGGIPLGAITAGSGGLSVQVPTAITLQTPTDGTMGQNNAAQTLTALTVFRGYDCVSLFNDQRGQWGDAEDTARDALFVDAARLLAQFECMTDFVGGTPGLSVNLPTGQINFASDGTLAKNYLAINALDTALGYVVGKTQGKLAAPDGMSKLFIVVPYQSWANLKTLVNFSYGGSAARITMVGPMMYFDGIPIFQENQTITGWEGASDVAAFVVHADAEALLFVEMLFSDFAKYGDTLWKQFRECFGWAGLIQTTHYAEVVNPAS